jgi:hypothetical protein
MPDLSEFTLPDGWTLEPIDYEPNMLVVRTPDPFPLMVTVDFAMRGFRNGFSTSRRLDSEGTYTGRGWRKALVAAAIRHLDDVLAVKVPRQKARP